MRIEGVWYGVHPHPPEIPGADSEIYAVVDVKPNVEGFEVLGARKLLAGEYEICHIPCYAYGLSLGDIVRTAPYLGQIDAISERVKMSGHTTIRVAFAAKNDREEILRMVNHLSTFSSHHEMCSEHLLGLDLADDGQIDVIEHELKELNEDGKVTYEFGDVCEGSEQTQSSKSKGFDAPA